MTVAGRVFRCVDEGARPAVQRVEGPIWETIMRNRTNEGDAVYNRVFEVIRAGVNRAGVKWCVKRAALTGDADEEFS